MSECSSDLQKFIFTFTIDTFHQVTILVEKSKAGKKKKKTEEKSKTKSFHTPGGKATSANIFLKSWEKDYLIPKNSGKGISSNQLF